jgi:hypothetical protein
MKASTQRDLFRDGTLVTPPTELSFDYSPIPVRASTFLAGLSQRAHRWFRLTPSFGPDLVREMIAELELPSSAHIHDPFSGAGTTAIEASLEGHPNSCIEVNPFLHFVNRVSLNWQLDVQKSRACLNDIRDRFQLLKATHSLDTIENAGVSIPPIHNVYRWWRPDVLLDILCIKAATLSVEPGEYRDFFRLALAAVLVPDLTNVTLGRLQLHFIDRSQEPIDAWTTFERHSASMIADLGEIQDGGIIARTNVVNGDSTSVDTYTRLPMLDAVITSPPYPNRYSYVWNTRPHLYLLDFISEAKEASAIDRRTIGGTWGTATSELQKGIYEPESEGVALALAGVGDRIRTKDTLMANYVVHYFNRLAQHLRAVSTRLSDKASLAYVVGNSSIKDEYVATDEILAQIIESSISGMRVNKIHRFRKRHSGVNLYESIVYASR